MKDEKYRRRGEGEVGSAAQSIRYACSECMGHQLGDVAGCTDPECWLYPWRTGTPSSRKRRISAEVGAAGAKRLARARKAK